VSYPSDLYSLEERQHKAIEQKKTLQPHDDSPPFLLSEAKGWGPVSIRNLYAAIDQSRSITCPRSQHSLFLLMIPSIRLIFGLGIPHIGEQTAKDLANAFQNDFKSFWTYLKAEAGLTLTFPSSLLDTTQIHHSIRVPITLTLRRRSLTSQGSDQ
jgi:NAD-dependent DNA ligase